jgi:hypothetical protein
MINNDILDNFFLLSNVDFTTFNQMTIKIIFTIKLITNPQVWRQGNNNLFLGKCHINPNVEFKR